MVEKEGPFIAVLSRRFKVYDTCATGSWSTTKCGASAGDMLPIGGIGKSWRVRPIESRAVVPLLDCTIRLPSASVCTDSLAIVAVYGAFCTEAAAVLWNPPTAAPEVTKTWFASDCA